MFKKTSIYLCLFGLPLLAGTQSLTLAKDGTLVTSAMGRNGDVNVEVTIKNNKIADVKVLDWSETHPIADLPKKVIPEEIVKNQSVNVNNVSGATLTSFAIKGAVRAALKEGGINVKDFQNKFLLLRNCRVQSKRALRLLLSAQAAQVFQLQ